MHVFVHASRCLTIVQAGSAGLGHPELMSHGQILLPPNELGGLSRFSRVEQRRHHEKFFVI